MDRGWLHAYISREGIGWLRTYPSREGTGWLHTYPSHVGRGGFIRTLVVGFGSIDTLEALVEKKKLIFIWDRPCLTENIAVVLAC